MYNREFIARKMAEQIQTTYHLICYSLLSLSALAALTGHQNRPQSSQQTHEMTVPNELIGCIIGKGGSKIAEIRYEYCMKSDICILHVVVSRPWLSLKTEVILVHELRWAKRFSRLTNFKNKGLQ